MPEVDDATAGERGVRVERGQSVGSPAREMAIDHPVQREGPAARFACVWARRAQGHYDGPGSGSLEVRQALHQPVGKRCTVRDDEEPERYTGRMTHPV